MFRILQIIASVDPKTGGPAEALLSQSKALSTRAVTDILSLDSPGSPFLENIPLKVFALGPRRRRNGRARFSSLGSLPRFVLWLIKNARRYDAIFVNGIWNATSIGASVVLPFVPVAYFVFTHGMLDPWFRKTYPIKHWAKQLFWLLFEGRLLAGAKAVLFTSREEAKLADGEFFGYAFKSEVIPFGISDVPAASASQEMAFHAVAPSLERRSYLLFLGRIHRKKGCDLLIQAFANIHRQYPDVDLVMAGPDSVGWTAELIEMTRLNKCADRVHWLGMIEGDAKWGALGGAYAFILPSHQENFGISVVEALACSLPVLITDKVNIWREIQDAGAGLVTSDDVDSVTAQLIAFLTTSTRTYDAMRTACRACFTESFEAARMADGLYALMVHAKGATPALALGHGG